MSVIAVILDSDSATQLIKAAPGGVVQRALLRQITGLEITNVSLELTATPGGERCWVKIKRRDGGVE